jgi:putative redox protein
MSNLRAVRLDWLGQGMRFRAVGAAPATPAIELDGDGNSGPSPMITLLMAAAGCTGADVVSILGKMRVALGQLTVEVEGERREEQPRRYTRLHCRYRLSGQDLDPAQAERAVALSLEKYCSVLASLAPDIQVTHEVILA